MLQTASRRTASTQAAATHTALAQIALIGNPNCGKTAVFNGLTGSKQRVGNWAGVTVERKSGRLHTAKRRLEVVDLPGIYSLCAAHQDAPDAQITQNYVDGCCANLLINVIDASNLERNLYLTRQLLEQGVSLIVALNMMDVAKSRGKKIDVQALSRRLGCPVIPMVMRKNQGLSTLIAAIESALAANDCLSKNASALQQNKQGDGLSCIFSQDLQNFLRQAAERPGWACGPAERMRLLLRCLEGEKSDLQWLARQQKTPDLCAQLEDQIKQLETQCQMSRDLILANDRYEWAYQISQAVTRGELKSTVWSERVDRLVLNRVLGIPIFLLAMYVLFFFAINVAGAFQEFFDVTSELIFVKGVAVGLTQLHSPPWLIALLAGGVGAGIHTTLTFIPVIAGLFFGLAWLEDSGYMTRAAFVIDKVLGWLGLPGKALMPMIIGLGCNVPAVMGLRTLERPRDRILTAMMLPFISCGARLAIFAVFVSAFFPKGGQNIIFFLYLLGIGVAILTGLVLRKTVLQGRAAPLLMEMPPYHLPRLSILLRHAWQQLRYFILRAGQMIVAASVILGTLNSITLQGQVNLQSAHQQAVLSQVGRWVTPVFAPIGIQNDNWPATVGLIAGVVAKEVVIGTLNALYTPAATTVPTAEAQSADSKPWYLEFSAAFASIGQHLQKLPQALANPILANEAGHDMNQSAYGVMIKQFGGTAAALAYLVFVLLYFPCISTLGAMRREIGNGWSGFSVIWSVLVSYGLAVIVYQGLTWGQHPLQSLAYMTTVGGLGALLLTGLYLWTSAQTKSHAKQALPTG